MRLDTVPAHLPRPCQVGVLVPRGRFDIEMYLSSLKLVGQVGQEYGWAQRAPGGGHALALR